LQSIFEAFRGKTYSWTRADLEKLFLEMSLCEIKLDKAAAWALNQDPDFYLDVLWRVGFLRAHAVGGIKALPGEQPKFPG